MHFERVFSEEYSFHLDHKSIRLCGLYLVKSFFSC